MPGSLDIICAAAQAHAELLRRQSSNPVALQEARRIRAALASVEALADAITACAGTRRTPDLAQMLDV